MDLATTALAGLHPDPEITVRDFRIGCIGAGFIMADVQLAAYVKAGFQVVAIASRTPDRAAAAAARWGIGRVHATPEALIADPEVEIVDIAFPPHCQPELVRAALRQPHIRGILVQKPIAIDLAEARRLVAEAEAAGKPLSVNQNMRFDQSIRVLKQLIDRGDLGEIVIGSIEMRAIPHWQAFLADYDRLTLLNMSIHHLDALRFLFGEPRSIYTAARRDPRTRFAHSDGICISTLAFDGPIVTSMEDVWAGPMRETDFEPKPYIRWRVEGTEGIAEGTVGWPDYPRGSPSTLRFASARSTGGRWVAPAWSSMWFPDAFAGVMGQLQQAVRAGTPPQLSATDNLRTMALVEAAYRSLREGRAVDPAEVREDGTW